MLALTWDDVNLETGEVNIDKQQIYLKSSGYITKDTKTSGSVRLVSIPPSVVTMLKKHRTEQLEQRLRLGSQWEDNDLIFTQWNGAPMHTTTPRQWLMRFIKRHNAQVQADADLTDGEKTALILPVIPYHGLRHTSATLLISQNIDVKTASARLGHSQASTFTDIYSHFLKSSDRKAADTLENLLSRDSKNGHA